MALNVTHEPSESADGPSDATIQRWQKLFQYSYCDAVTAIENHRNNIARKHVSDALWALVREQKEPEGHDRESYEHELELERRRKPKPKKFMNASSTLDNGRYLVKIDEHVTTKLLQTLSGSIQALKVERGRGDDGDADFCIINAAIKDALLEKISTLSSRPTIVRLAEPAAKNLSSISRYPTLGLDTTLPQNRPWNKEKDFLPAQDQYPVWYFFYGNLADPAVLRRHLGLASEPILWPASIRGGILKTWAGKYRALVDGIETSIVNGHAFEVQARDHEDALRAYETSKYEVVRCMIEIGDHQISGCTFRFVGEVDGTGGE